MALVVLILAVLFGVPALLSTDMGRKQVEARLNEQFEGPVTVGDLSVGLFAGVVLKDLVIQQPPGHGDGEALRVDRFQADLSYLSLLWGQVDAEVRIESPRLVVHRNADGRINWQDLLDPTVPQGAQTLPGGEGPVGRAPGGTGRPSMPPRAPRDAEDPDWSAFRFQVSLTDGSVEIHEQGPGLVHALRDLEFTTGTGPDGPPWVLKVTARMEDTDPATEDGRFTLDGTLDPRGQGAATLDLQTDRIDLSVYQPLLAGFGVEVDEFRGVLEGNLTARMQGEDVFEVGGDLRATDVAVAGPALGGHSVHIPTMVLQPALQGDAAQGAITNDAFLVDLTFLKLHGLPAADTKGLFADETAARPLGFRVELDLPAMKEHTSFIPEVVEELAGQMDLQLGARSTQKGNLAAWMSAPLEFVVRGGAKDLDVGGSFAPSDLRIPSDLNLSVVGTYDLETGVLEVPDSVVQLGQTALHAGLTFDPAARLGTTLTLDVDGELAQHLAQVFGPDGLSANGSLKLTTTLDSEWPLNTDEWTALLAGMNLSGSLTAPDVMYRENRLSGAGLGFQVDDGKAGLTLADTANLNGGGLTLASTFEPGAKSGSPVSVDLGWDGGQAGASLTPLLQYALPLLSGLSGKAGAGDGSGATLDFQSGINLGLNLAGPVQKEAGESWLDYLGRWTGKGNVGLQDGGFTPGNGLGELASLLGQEDKVSFKRMTSAFEFDQGLIRIPKVALRTGGAPLLLSGSTSLSGALEFELDVSEFLKERIKDERLAALLGDGSIKAAHLGGTLWKPELDLGDVLKDSLTGITNNLKETLTDRIKEDPGGALKDALNLFNREKDKKKDGDKKKGDGAERCP